jgi:pyruvate dehydrogenase E1 component alpha subunit
MSSLDTRNPLQYNVEKVQILDEDGTVRDDAEVPDLSDEKLLEMYRMMLLGRYIHESAEFYHKQGLGLYPTLAGQEAHVAAAYALDDDDWMYEYGREGPAMIAHGYSMDKYALRWTGNEAGNVTPEGVSVSPYDVSVGAHILRAVGCAWAHDIKGQNAPSLVFFGDGATSQGTFHEALNFAGVLDLPTVFMCNNNQWAISTPFEKQSASRTIAQRAVAYDVPGVLVDGMDPLAVYQVTKEAIDRAKNPDDGDPRPTLIESLQYRYGAHSVIDDADVYRNDDHWEEEEEWKEKDSLPRMETFLTERDILDEDLKEELQAEVKEEWDEAVEIANETPKPDPRVLFENVFEEPTWNLHEQYEELERYLEEFGEKAILEASAREWEFEEMSHIG